jgi:hypothetical protein
MRVEFRVMLALLGAAMLAASATGAQTPGTSAFTDAEATKLRDGRLLTIWDVRREPGRSTGFHQHAFDEISVALTDGAVKVARPDGTWSIEQHRMGSVRFDSKGTIHSEEGLSVTPSRSIVFQLKPAEAPQWPATAGIPGQFPRVGAVKLFETDHVVVWDQTWRAGERITRHLHYRQTAAVFLEGGKLRTIDDGRPPNAPFVRQAGDILYSDAAAPLKSPHEEEQVEGSPRAIWLEFK